MLQICLFIFITSISQIGPNAWNGIVPLRSTRADVERLIGKPIPESKAPDAAIYRTQNELVFVQYSIGQCDINSGSVWKVPRGTVIRVSVEPYVKPKFAAIKLDESKYSKRKDPESEDLIHYTSDEEGVSITVNTANGSVVDFNYFPLSKDEHLRCPAPKASSLIDSGIKSVKIDEYSEIPWESERKRLDNFTGQLLQAPTSHVFIISYGGKRTYAAEAERLGERAKRYLVSSNRIEAVRIVTMNGGYRDRWTIELYLVPSGANDPMATPTIAPNEVQIIKNRMTKIGARRSSRLGCQ